ncbi:hypothetical protein NXG61_11835 [Pectinatus haikarae]
MLLGQYFYDNGEYEKCIASLSKSKYKYEEKVLLLMAVSYKNLFDYDKAIYIIEHILKKNPEYVPGYIQLAYIYKDKKLYIDEIKLLVKADQFVRQQKQTGQIHDAVYLAEIYSMLASAYVKIGKSKKACRYFLFSSREEEDYTKKIEEYSNALFVLNYIDDINDKAVYKLHINYQKFFNYNMQYHDFDINKSEKKIKIGYISPDFRRHPVLSWTSSLLLNYTKNQFEVYCYSAGAEDDITEKLRKRIDPNWRNIKGLSADKAAELIYDDKINILFDFSGHTANNCLPILAYRPAPVQISGIGYFNTTGLDTVDYFLSDCYCVSDNAASYFCEKIIRMPHSHICYTPLGQMPETADAPCLKNGFVTFGCFNNFNKVNDFILSLWAKILYEIPAARLILKSSIFDNDQGRQYAGKLMEKYEIDAERVVLRSFTKEYLEEYNDIDIALDTYPYTGGVTSCETLYMGVPLISLCGRRHGARFGCSILKNMGADELIAYSAQEYINKAVYLANNIKLIDVYHKTLRNKMNKSFLMDYTSYVKDIENIYKYVWNKYLIIG